MVKNVYKLVAYYFMIHLFFEGRVLTKPILLFVVGVPFLSFRFFPLAPERVERYLIVST